jgi:HK97 family phage prohead protease
MDTHRKRKERHRAVPLAPEVRHFTAKGLEVRSDEATDEIVITGQPIVYNVPYAVRDVFGEFEERMIPGCASDMLTRGVDCRLLLNHEGLPMARTTAGTLRLWDTAEALHFEAKLDSRQQLATDFAIAIERGDVSQMSVGMCVGRDEWSAEAGKEMRDIFGLDDLMDVSGVTYPCSAATNIEIARRMAFAMPEESRARIRKMYVEVRAGKVLSKGNQDKLVDAVNTLHEVLDGAGTSPDPVGEPSGGDEPVEEPIAEEPAAVEEPVVEESPDRDERSQDNPAEQRDDPTVEDYGIARALAEAKTALAAVKAKQLADPDYQTDPDDAAVMSCIEEAESALDKAIIAQSKDGHDEPAVRSTATLRLQLEARKRRRIAA